MRLPLIVNGASSLVWSGEAELRLDLLRRQRINVLTSDLTDRGRSQRFIPVWWS